MVELEDMIMADMITDMATPMAMPMVMMMEKRK